MLILNLFLLALLILFTAFFVATEFAIVKVRTSKIDQLLETGNKKAEAAKKVISNLDEYLSACQLGITITALGLGWLGEPTIERILHPILEPFNLPGTINTILSFSIAFFLVTFLHVVLGELAPKTFAIQKAEQITMLFSKPIIWFYRIMYPFIWLLNGSAQAITRLFGVRPASEHEVAHSEEELRIILSESYEKGEINQSEYKFVNRIFEFDNRLAKEIMIPRTEMVTLTNNASLEDNLKIMTTERYTRYPIVNGDKDHITGMIHAKEVFSDLVKMDHVDLSTYTRPVIQVLDSTPISKLLIKMQQEQIHLAILLDEYGGTAGLVTVEDILEEIVGEIRDEFDSDEHPLIQKLNDAGTNFMLDGKVLIEEVNDLLEIDIEDGPIDTIGGLMLFEKPEVQEGENISFGNWKFIPREMEGQQIRMIEAIKKEEAGLPSS
ncbi:hemolysin family protein [Alteribacillus sp. YIM 98480]|uniref:hemolysin family protein n=1 Tax=Alteribacillus sp. YIM 98480 TaxID=2606599 RepID=UPI00131DB517|nr:hemolysin family protein [Alteribacillus sp. YIM 98480]